MNSGGDDHHQAVVRKASSGIVLYIKAVLLINDIC